MKKIRLLNEPKISPKFDAFPYQREAVEAIRDLEYAAVFHEQGLGKTKIAIDILLYWLETSSVDTVMIVTKKQLVQNWKWEFATHTFIKPTVLTSDRANNRFVFLSPSRVIITNFEVLQIEMTQMVLFLKTRNVAVIIDESTKLKNPESKLTKVFFELSPFFRKRIIMTGTPIANRPYDIWAQIFFLDSGQSLGSNFTDFKQATDLTNNLGDNKLLQESFEKELSEIMGKIAGFSVRETKNSGIVSLPDKIFIREETELTLEQKALYEKIRDELQVEVTRHNEITVDDSTAIVKRLLRLVQITSNPFLVDESYRGKSAKEAVLELIVKRLLENSEKCIVWTSFIENVNYFNKIYSEFGSVKIHGGMNISDRNRSVERFRLPEYKILFATPTSAKEGLTLTEANHVIFYDRGFSLDDYLQAQDRIHRISQSKTCYVHNIIANDTIDEWIDTLLHAKQNAASLAQGDVTLSEYRTKANYSFGEIVKRVLNIQDNMEGTSRE